MKYQTRFLIALAAIGVLQGCQTQPTRPVVPESAPYRFNLHAQTNDGYAPTAFDDGAQTFFAAPSDHQILQVIECRTGIPAVLRFQTPYWVVDGVSPCWDVTTADGKYRLATRSFDSVTPTPAPTVSVPRAPVARAGAISCASLDAFEKRLKRTQAKISKLSRLMDEIGNCENTSATPAEPLKIAIPFQRGTRMLDDAGRYIIESLAPYTRDASKIVLTGRFLPGEKPKVNKWFTTERVKAVRRALQDAGVPTDIIDEQITQVTSNNLWVGVKIIR